MFICVIDHSVFDRVLRIGLVFVPLHSSVCFIKTTCDTKIQGEGSLAAEEIPEAYGSLLLIFL